MENIDLRKYLAVKESRTGRKRYSPEILLKIILFAFMENGYVSTREIEKLCKTDIRFMYLSDEHPAPGHMTIDNFMNDVLSVSRVWKKSSVKNRKKTFDKVTLLLDEINKSLYFN